MRHVVLRCVPAHRPPARETPEGSGVSVYSFLKELRALRETAQGSRGSEYRSGYLDALSEVLEIGLNELELEEDGRLP